MTYVSTKTYGHEVGLSACFRQWRARSHCRFFHGYALSVKLTFHAEELDENNWVVDFGGLKDVKEWLQERFDHKMVIARDDPFKEQIMGLEELGLAEIVVLDQVGCEAFAKYVFEGVSEWLESRYGSRVLLGGVEVREHGANSAMYLGSAFNA